MRSTVIVGVLILSLVTLSLVSLNVAKKQTLQQKATESIISPKKGVGGPATLTTLSQLKASWFYNWYYQPTYKDLTQNWDSVVWQKFIPLIYGNQFGSAAAKINDICSRTNLGYCNKGNYYLIGNEPDVESQDKIPGSTNAPLDAAILQGRVIKAVKAKDPTAKFIIFGLSNGTDAVFIQNFIIEWKNYWQVQDPAIADLSTVIKGWHFHNYANYDVCPLTDDLPRRFVNTVNQQMLSSFGKIVPNQEIWITEMGSLAAPDPNDTSPTGRANRQAFLNRMSCLTNVYENSPLVTRYAWFYHGCDPASTTWTGCPTVKCTSYNLFYVRNCSSAGGPFEISDLGTRYSILPAVVSPTSVPINSPTPTPSTKASLTFKIKFQGVTGNNTSAKTVNIILKQGAQIIGTFNNISVTNINDGSGKYQGNIPNINPGVYDVFVKGFSHLQRKFAGVTLSPGNNTIDWSGTILLAGDLNNDNWLRINDVSAILSKYVVLSAPVTIGTGNYDLNCDNIINIQDISLVLANYVRLETEGEK